MHPCPDPQIIAWSFSDREGRGWNTYMTVSGKPFVDLANEARMAFARD
jgi:hypothetical protein